MIPVIEVSHLSSSAAFYAAITQPLGIRFLSSTSPSTLHFGLPAFPPHPDEVLFTLSETPNPAFSRIRVEALSPDAVTEFHKRALRATDFFSTHLLHNTPDVSIARTKDLDGNMLEASWFRPSGRRNSAPNMGTASTPKEARRVLDWQRDVALSLSSPSFSPRARSPEVVPRIMRRETAPSRYHVDPEQERPRGSALSNQALIGTFLGAAAGAAVAYAIARSEEPRRRRPMPRLVEYHEPISAGNRIMEMERTIEPSHGRASERDSRSKHLARYTVVGSGSRRESGDFWQAEEEKLESYGNWRKPRPSLLDDRPPLSSISRNSRNRDMGYRPLAILPSSRDVQDDAGIRPLSYAGERTSRRSEASTAKPSPSRSRSHVTTTWSIKGADFDREKARSRRGSDIGARHVPLPQSLVSSVVPSDSVSNSGSRRQWDRERERRRYRDY